MSVSDLDFLAEFLAVDRRDIDVLADELRRDECPEHEIAFNVREILNPDSERTVPEWYQPRSLPEADAERQRTETMLPGHTARPNAKKPPGDPEIHEGQS